MSNQDETQDTEKLAHNRFKRPHYAIGSRVRVMVEGSHLHQEGEVIGINPVQRMDGYVATYLYTLRMDNLSRQEWQEECLAPLTE